MCLVSKVQISLTSFGCSQTQLSVCEHHDLGDWIITIVAVANSGWAHHTVREVDVFKCLCVSEGQRERAGGGGGGGRE